MRLSTTIAPGANSLSRKATANEPDGTARDCHRTPGRVTGVVASQGRPRCGERREHIRRLVVVEPTLHFRRSSVPQGRERLGVDRGTIVYDRKKQRPVRRTHSRSDDGVERFSGSAELLRQHPCTLAIPGGDPLGMRLRRFGLSFLKLHGGPAQCLRHLFERCEDAMWESIHAARLALRPRIRETIPDNADARTEPCRATCSGAGVLARPTRSETTPPAGPRRRVPSRERSGGRGLMQLPLPVLIPCVWPRHQRRRAVGRPLRREPTDSAQQVRAENGRHRAAPGGSLTPAGRPRIAAPPSSGIPRRPVGGRGKQAAGRRGRRADRAAHRPPQPLRARWRSADVSPAESHAETAEPQQCRPGCLVRTVSTAATALDLCELSRERYGTPADPAGVCPVRSGSRYLNRSSVDFDGLDDLRLDIENERAGPAVHGDGGGRAGADRAR